MRLDKIWISEFKNLVDVTIDFDETCLTTALIGKNTAGKSNLIEALVSVFRNLDLDEDPIFSYMIKYECRGKLIEIKADSKKQPKIDISVDGKKITNNVFRKDKRKYLPSNIFAYYSGSSKRLESYFYKHQKKFYDGLLNKKKAPLRPLFFARPIHSQYVLLAFFSFEDKKAKKFLKDYLNITDFIDATFILKQPEWGKDKTDFFWGARGVVRNFLNDLVSVSLPPLRETERVRVGLKKYRTQEKLYVHLPDLKSLRDLADRYVTNVEFFKMLESTYLSELIQELKIKVKKTRIEDPIQFPELSEGEQQLLIVLGLLKFMKEEESLFLLDEPDTHLNPSWKFEYLDLLENVVGKNENSHIIIITHDPLLIGSLKKEQVQIFSPTDKNKTIEINPPDIDPIGLGVDGLLIDIFGLDTTLDLKTQKKLKQREDLIAKRVVLEKELTDSEASKLNQLNEELIDLGFLSTVRDPLYKRFLGALRKNQINQGVDFSEMNRKDQIEFAKKAIEAIRDESK